MACSQILIAGFGGQGVLFAGKVLAYKGLTEDKQISWLPSYGPEMRGGTANCSVIISDTPVGSPIVSAPDILIVMNLPSLDKYENAVVPGGKVFIDSFLIERKIERTDIEAHYIPATKIAREMGIPTLANMVIVGKVIRETGVISMEGLRDALAKTVSAKHQELIDVNLRAIQAGYEFRG